ncbi:MAG: Loki-CTERM sorting domain-containing protein, partial [Candidatus Hermodarchaeota archaeon]
NEVGLIPVNFTNPGQIILLNCSYSNIKDIEVSQCSIGIGLYYSDNNTISLINTTFNSYSGIYIYQSDKNNITESIIEGNGIYGIYISSLSDNNSIYSNSFIGNQINAMNYGGDNKWDNGSIGNYWDDYTGCDSNGDGIGETPYIMNGVQDNCPITKKRCTSAPISGGGDDDDDDEEPQVVQIPGYDLILIIAVICSISIVIGWKKIRQ